MVDVLYDEEWNRKILNKEDREEARKQGQQEGMQRGIQKGVQVGADGNAIKVYNNCLDRGMSEADAISLSEISDEALAVARKQRSERTNR